MSSLRLEPGSFRDPDGRVLRGDGVLYRLLSAKAWEDWCALRDSRLFGLSTADGRLVATEEVDLATLDLPVDGTWAGALRHREIPFVSYPYEWSFSMLRQAALLQLDLTLEALEEDLALKDASAFNLQFVGSSPTFIDIGSFERRAEGEPWIGYLQFCQHFLYPLLLTAYRGVDFHPLLRGSLDGISPAFAAAVLRGRDVFRPGVLTHVRLQAKLQEKAQATDVGLRQTLREAGLKKQIVRHNLTRIRRLVERLTWSRDTSTWSDYGREDSYSEAAADDKEAFVAEVLGRHHWSLVWDLGCNTGRFAKLASPHADYVVAMDGDPLVADRLYRSLTASEVENVLPLVIDLLDPSPARGWRLTERKTLTERGKPDLVLCLAVLHHLCLTGNVPLADAVDWLASFGARLVVEFVAPDDPQARRLVRNRSTRHVGYDLDHFEALLAAKLTVRDRRPLEGGSRYLFFAEP